MSNIYKNVTELIGRTPLVEVEKIEKRFKLQARLLVKLDGYNPAGSAKDRIAYQMIQDAEEAGRLKEGSVIIEPTSGNTGIGLAAIGASKGYRVILIMPETMSVERRNLLKAFNRWCAWDERSDCQSRRISGRNRRFFHCRTVY